MGEGRGTAGILPVRKCPPLGSGREERYPRAGGCGRHGQLPAPSASMLGKLLPAEPLPRTAGSHGARSAPRPSAARLPLPQVTLPRAQVKRSEMYCPIHCAGCLDCPSAESSLCAPGLSGKSCYSNIIITHLRLKSAFCLREEFFSAFEETSPPTHITHTFPKQSSLCC